ncbi:helix-turn-helix domain-containing protein [Pilimelia terevasa]|nr:helix-turn-helix transcriptional regulator [Pilimelia terevasa]
MSHYFGAELRHLRLAAGLSQAEPGRKIRYTADTVRRCETAERVPSDRFVADCDAVLGARGALSTLWKTARFHAVRRPTAGDAGFRATALDRPALEWLLGTLRPEAAPRALAAPDEVVLGRASGELERRREADHQYGAGVVHEQITALITGEVAALRSASDGPAATPAGRSLVVGAYELAGYAAVDVGAVGAAQQLYLDGLAAAHTDRLYGGYLLGVSLAHLALHCGDATTALRMRQAAAAGTNRCSTPAVRAALSAVEARAHAPPRRRSGMHTRAGHGRP